MHLATNVKMFLSYELEEKFAVEFEKRAGITTDCESEMVAATSGGHFGNRYSCIGHIWNNVVKNGLCSWSSPDEKKLVLVINIHNFVQSSVPLYEFYKKIILRRRIHEICPAAGGLKCKMRSVNFKIFFNYLTKSQLLLLKQKQKFRK